MGLETPTTNFPYDQGFNESLKFTVYIDGPKGNENLILRSCETVFLDKSEDKGEHCSVVDVINKEIVSLPPKRSHFGFENFKEFIFALISTGSFEPDPEGDLVKCLRSEDRVPSFDPDKDTFKI